MRDVLPNLVRSFVVWLVCITLAVYLMNPGAGVRELVPDSMPFVGNLDEAVAALILISGLRYCGLDIARFFSKGEK